MTLGVLPLNGELHQYVLNNTVREPAILRELREQSCEIETVAERLLISPDQGQLLSFLTSLTNAKTILEIGTFTGYSALAMALALPDGGKLITCDISDRHSAFAKAFWRKTGLHEKIDQVILSGLKFLELLETEGKLGCFDLIFLDADKQNNDAYFESGLKLLRPGGLMVVDNVLWKGLVADPNTEDKRTKSIQAFNEKCFHDERIDLSVLTVGDGMLLARKR